MSSASSADASAAAATTAAAEGEKEESVYYCRYYWVPTPEMCDAHCDPRARTRLLAGRAAMPYRPLEQRARALADAAVAVVRLRLQGSY
jgi:hypothetical protein